MCAACWRAPRTDRAIVCSPVRIATLAMSVVVSIASQASFFKDTSPRIRIVEELEVPIERWSPSPRPLGPLDQDDGALPDHVVEAEIARFVGLAQTVAIDVIDGNGAGGAGGGGGGRGGGNGQAPGGGGGGAP